MSNIGLIVICTGKYDCFLEQLIASANKYFFCGEKFNIYLFTDKMNMITHKRGDIHMKKIPTLTFPYPTLYRYKWISENWQMFKSPMLYYIDVDMRFVDYIGRDIFPDHRGIVAVRHPGYFYTGWGDNKTLPLSTAYVPIQLKHTYYAGGFQGGLRENYLHACSQMADNISYDESRGIIAEWNDESHWNHYLKFHPHKSLGPEYCMVEQENLREKWRINHIKPKIIALEKDHNKIRL